MAEAKHSSLPLDDETRRLIRRKALQMVGKVGLRRQDQQGLEQELTADLLKRLPRWKPERGSPHAFVRTIVSHCAADILRRLKAKKRAPATLRSLNITVPSEDGPPTELSALVGSQELHARLCRAPRSELEQHQLATDVEALIQKLPPRLAQLAEALKEYSQAEAARQLGVPRSTLQGWVRELRERFEQAGLQHYLGDAPSTRPRTG